MAKKAAPKKGLFRKAYDLAVNFVYGDTMQQKAAQAAAEISQGLFSQANAYVPYGPGQMTPTIDPDPKKSHEQEIREASERPAPERDRGIER